MNFLSRAFLSTKERLGKSGLLFLVLTTICVFVLSGISIQEATNKASVFAREKLGASVTLEANMQKIKDQMKAEGGNKFQVKTVPVPMSDVDQVLKLPNIDGYNFTSTATGIAEGFNPISSETTAAESEDPRRKITGNLKLEGVLDQSLTSLAQEGTIKLVEGEGITKENAGQDVCVISQTLASENDLKVGDTVKVESPIDGTTYSMKIQGIYTTSAEIDEMAVRHDSMNPYNEIFVPYTLANTFKGESAEGSVDKATFYLNDPINVESFVKEGEKLDIDYNTFMLDANNRAYETMMGPIENVGAFAGMTVLIVTIAGAIIMALIIILSIKERRNEIGILLSLGEGKFKIVSQFFVEILIVLVLSLGVSAGLGNVVSKQMGNALVQKEVSVTEQSQVDTGFGRGPQMHQEKEVETLTSLDVNVSGKDFAEMSGIAILIALIAIGIPSVGIMRLQPKEILSKHD